MLNWRIITLDTYTDISEKSNETLYYITDIEKIYKGEIQFSIPHVLFSDNPTSSVMYKVYINDKTLEGIIWSGKEWGRTIDPAINYNSCVQVSSAELDSTLGRFVFTHNNVEDSVYISNMEIYITYDIQTMTTVLIKAIGYSTNKTNVNLSSILSASISNGYLTLGLDGSQNVISFNMNKILTNYVSTDTVNLVLTGSQFIADSLLIQDSSTKYVYLEDDNVHLVSNLVQDNVIFPNDYINSSISDIVSAISNSLKSHGNMRKVDPNRGGEVLIANDNGDAALSGVKIGGDRFKDVPDCETLATEKGIVTFVDEYAVKQSDIIKSSEITEDVEEASDDKIPSEKAVIDILSWYTL